MTTSDLLQAFPPKDYLLRPDVLRIYEERLHLSPDQAKSAFKSLLEEHYIWRSARGFGLTAVGRKYREVPNA